MMICMFQLEIVDWEGYYMCETWVAAQPTLKIAENKL